MKMHCSVCGEPRDVLSSGGRGECCKNEQLPANAKRFCSFCGRQTDEVTRSGRGECCANVHTGRQGSKHESAVVDSFTPWIEDYSARAWVVHRPDGATLEEVGDAIGLTRERVRQIEKIAKHKLLIACQEEGLEPIDFLRYLQQRNEETNHSRNVGSDPFAGGPSEELRSIKEALDIVDDEDDEHDGRTKRLAEEFYDEKNARALALFDALDLEPRAYFLTKVTARALAIEGVEEPMPFKNENPWTQEQLGMLDSYVRNTSLGLAEAARQALAADTAGMLGGRNSDAVAQKILNLRKKLGLHTPRVSKPRKEEKRVVETPQEAPVSETVRVGRVVHTVCEALLSLPLERRSRVLRAAAILTVDNADEVAQVMEEEIETSTRLVGRS